MAQLYGVYIIDTSQPVPMDSSIGTGLDGGFAEYVLVNQVQLVPVPDGMPPEVAAVATDSLLVAFNAVNNVAQVSPGDKVLTYGVGGLGHQALQIAKHLGATVYAVDLRPEARQLALGLGATQVFDLEELTAMTGNGTFHADIVIDFVASVQSFELSKAAEALVASEGFSGLSRPGTIVIVGYSADSLSFASADLVNGNIRVLTSVYGSKDTMCSALSLLSEGVVRPDITVTPLEHVNAALEALTAHEVTGRIVVMPGLDVDCTNGRRPLESLYDGGAGAQILWHAGIECLPTSHHAPWSFAGRRTEL